MFALQMARFVVCCLVDPQRGGRVGGKRGVNPRSVGRKQSRAGGSEEQVRRGNTRWQQHQPTVTGHTRLSTEQHTPPP